jgi:5'-AMP-activated protein kinase catalytic alpha subunit
VAEHRLTRQKVAIKILNRAQFQAKGMEKNVIREIKILQYLMHPHVVQLYEVVRSPSDIFLVMEYMEEGELHDHVVLHGRGFAENEARRLFQQIISGLEFCHRNMIVHRDLKLENLLLDSTGSVKIIDFGLGNVMRDGHFLKTHCGSYNYAAPELLAGKLYAGPEVDVWSSGVILYVLLCGGLPFDDANIPQLLDKIKNGVYFLPSHLTPGSRDLIAHMLVVDPLRRITIAEIKMHAWFQARLPRYLAVPYPDSNQQAKNIDEDILQAVTSVGFDRRDVIKSLQDRVQNQATVVYYLVRDKLRRSELPYSYLNGDIEETGEPGSHGPTVEHLPAQDLIQIRGRPSGSSSGGIKIHHHTLTSTPSLQNARRERSWALGLTSSRCARQIMMDIFYTMRSLRISWKNLGSYCLRCRWPPMPASNVEDYFERPRPSAVSSVQGVDPRPSPSAGTAVGEVAAGSRVQKECYVVKFEIQLYKGAEGEYTLDFLSIEGPLLPFFDVCTSLYRELNRL